MGAMKVISEKITASVVLDVWNVEDSFLRGTGGRSWGEVLRGGLEGRS